MSSWDISIRRPNGEVDVLTDIREYNPDDAIHKVRLGGLYSPTTDRIIRCIEVDRKYL